MPGQRDENMSKAKLDASKTVKGIATNKTMSSNGTNSKTIGVASLVVLLAVTMMIGWFNDGWTENDQWFILANGRYIIDHGFPYENPFSMWGGRIVIENWGWSVLCWLAWDHLGEQAGLTILSLIVLALSVLVCWCIIRRLCDDYTAALVGSALYAFTALAAFSIRPWMISSLFMLLSIYLIVRWMQDGKTHWLVLLPVVTLVAFNTHMAMAWMTILLPGCWMLATVIIKPHKLKTICTSVITVACQIAVMFINPYGLDGVLFLFRSYGATKYRNSIVETLPLLRVLSSRYLFSLIEARLLTGLLAALILVYGMIMVIVHKKNMDKTLLLGAVFMMIGFSIATWTAVRNSTLFLVALPIAVAMSANGDDHFNSKNVTGARSSLSQLVTDLAVIGFTAIASVAVLFDVFFPPSTVEKALIEKSDAGTAAEAVKSIVPAGSKIVSDGWLGSKLTFEGYRTSYDMRPELLTPAITGLNENYLTEQIDATNNVEEANKFIDKYKNETKWWIVWTHDYQSGIAYALKSRPDAHLMASSSEYKWYLYEIR